MEDRKRKNATRDDKMYSKSSENSSKRRRIDIGAESAEIQQMTTKTETQEQAVGGAGIFQPDSSANLFKMPDASHYAASPPADELLRCQRCITNLLPCLPHLGGKGVCFHCASSDRLCFPNSSSSISTQLNAMEQLIVDLREEGRQLRKKNHYLESSHRNLEIKMAAEISRLDDEINELRGPTNEALNSASESGGTTSSESIDPGPFTNITLGTWHQHRYPFESGDCHDFKSLDIEFTNPGPTAWDIGALIKQFGSFSGLGLLCSLSASIALHFRPTPQFQGISNLRLVNMIDIDALSIFSLLQQLTHVKFSEVTFTKPAAAAVQKICSPLLTSLSFLVCDNESWISSLSCPSITTFAHSGDVFPISFLRSHPSVIALNYSNDENPDILHEIESTLPDLKSLGLDNLECFNNLNMAPREAPHFPRLEHLTLYREVTFDEFKDVVRTRCLPICHSQSQLPASLKPLETLSILHTKPKCICHIVASSQLEEPSTNYVAPDPYWPDLETLVLSWSGCHQQIQ